MRRFISSPLRRILAIAGAVGLTAVLLAAAGAGLAWRWYNAAPQHAPDAVAARVIIEPGDTVTSVVRRLTVAETIDRPLLLRWLIVAQGLAGALQVGEYEFAPGASPAEIVDRLVRGDVVLHWVSLIEGHTLAESLERLRAAAPALVTTLPGDASAGAAIAAALDLARDNPEGLFFPDTYAFQRGATDLDILRRARDRLRATLDAAWNGRSVDLPLATPYEALILASIIEKETGVEGDRPRIAQVFVDRLRRGMRLQTDPTVIYGLGTAFAGDLTRAHLRADSPYNTYTRHGLPPTPIALVGRNSIEAALHPADTDYLYFVARGDGSSEFSRTLAEHTRAVRQFQLSDTR